LALAYQDILQERLPVRGVKYLPNCSVKLQKMASQAHTRAALMDIADVQTGKTFPGYSFT
jgi:hypothetical protein